MIVAHFLSLCQLSTQTLDSGITEGTELGRQPASGVCVCWPLVISATQPFPSASDQKERFPLDLSPLNSLAVHEPDQALKHSLKPMLWFERVLQKWLLHSSPKSNKWWFWEVKLWSVIRVRAGGEGELLQKRKKLMSYTLWRLPPGVNAAWGPSPGAEQLPGSSSPTPPAITTASQVNV